MKISKLLLAFNLIIISFAAQAQVGIGTNTPAASAQLEVSSSSKGFLPPRMTYAQLTSITSPAEGLMVYCTDCIPKGLFVYDGSNWTLSSGGVSPSSPTTVPDAPAITGVTSGNGQVVVAFTAPANNGGSTITTYTATSSPGGITGTVSQAGSGTITVSGLTNGTAYTFTVTATNSFGTSAVSTASSSVTPKEQITYTILDQYTNSVPTGTNYVELEYYNQYIDAGSIDASPFVITKRTSYSGGILFYGSTELNSTANENTYRLTATSGNFNFISFNLDGLEDNIGGDGTASTIPKITLTSSLGNTISYQSSADYNGYFYMYMFMDAGIKTLNWNNVEWVDIKTQYVKAKTKNYVLKAL